MSLPEFPKAPSFTREEVINQIIASVAMEELGLSHIINAEGEKLQYVLGTLRGATGPEKPVTVDELIRINESIRDTLDKTAENNQMLADKMQTALSSSVLVGPTGPTGPTGPPGTTGSGSILPFGGLWAGYSTEPFITTLYTTPEGHAKSMTLFGFTNCVPYVVPDLSGVLDTVQLTGVQSRPLFLPRDATITSLSANFFGSGNIFSTDATIHARVYQTSIEDDNFKAITETDLALAPKLSDITRYSGIKTGLNIPVTAGTRLMIGFYLLSPGEPKENDAVGYVGGALVLA